ncbi:hypothetical protein ASD44_16915 [Mesorhizobium sp. Root554]|nr:hypothetical protein ASD27_16920 [Mesorhizobium sp. Root1471]KQZ38057.1 hypothetical protein ASD44_16915 [Mesorhizobium sp. Root554]
MPGSYIKTKRQKLCRADDLLVAEIDAKVGGFGLIPIESDGAIVSGHYFLFEINQSRVVLDWFDHIIRDGRLHRQVDAVGSTNYAAIRPRDVGAFQMPLPALAEQSAIAEVLGVVVEAIAKTRTLIEALVESRNELTRDFQGSEKQPKWHVQAIGSLVRQCQYGLSIPLDGKGTVPVLRMPDIGDGKVNVDVRGLKSTDVTPAEIASCSIKKGDILFNRTNSQALVGKTGIVRHDPSTEVVFASYLIRLVVKNSVNPYWLNAILNLPRTQERLKTLATPGVSQWNINSKTLKRFSIAVPPKAEQDSFADLYETIEARLTAERAKLDVLYQTQSSLAQELLSGRVRLPDSIIARHRGKAGQAA